MVRGLTLNCSTYSYSSMVSPTPLGKRSSKKVRIDYLQTSEVRQGTRLSASQPRALPGFSTSEYALKQVLVQYSKSRLGSVHCATMLGSSLSNSCFAWKLSWCRVKKVSILVWLIESAEFTTAIGSTAVWMLRIKAAYSPGVAGLLVLVNFCSSDGEQKD